EPRRKTKSNNGKQDRMENQIEIYQDIDGQTGLEVRFEQDTVWLTNNQLVELFDSSKAKLDDTIQSKVMAMVFSMASEIERDMISKRTRESLASKKQAGVKLGRPKGPGKNKLDKFKPEIEALLNNGSTQQFIAKRYQVTEATLSNWIKKNQVKK